MVKITTQIESWMNNLVNNALEPGSDLPAFAQPLLGFASGKDDLFYFLKADIGPEFYWTPAEAFSSAFPDERIKADELSVIAWVLPQTEHTRLAYRKATNVPSVEWSKARHYGEKVNENLRRYVVELFKTGHDKVKCKEYIRNVTAVHVEKEQLGYKVNSCGLCQTKVPCEHRNPHAIKIR